MAVDYFLKIEGIEGESQDDKHKNEIELAAFNWSESQAGTLVQGGSAGKVQMKNLEFRCPVSKASPKLMLACATGQRIPKATLTCRKAGGGQQEFYKITLSDVLVALYESSSKSAVGTDGATEDGYSLGEPVDRIGLNFGKIQVEYRPQKADGSLDNPIKAGYNLKANKSV